MFHNLLTFFFSYIFKRIILNSFNEYSNIPQTAQEILKKTKGKIPPNKRSLLEQRLKELIQAKRSSSMSGLILKILKKYIIFPNNLLFIYRIQS